MNLEQIKKEVNQIMENNFEIILLNIVKGGCSMNCEYCYAREILIEQLSQFDKSRPRSIHMPIEVVEHCFKLFHRVGIKKAGLIGGESCEYKHWYKLLKLADQYNIDLLVYTGGLKSYRLLQPRIKEIILHPVVPLTKILPNILSCLKSNTKIHLRINFDHDDLREKEMIYSFFSQIPKKFHHLLSLKYSITSKIKDENVAYFNLLRFNSVKTNLFDLLAEIHNNYPQIKKIWPERPLFQCCISDEEREKYSFANIGVGRCEMEPTVYHPLLPQPNNSSACSMSLCPPTEDAFPKYYLRSSKELLETLKALIKENTNMALKPSFIECQKCQLRLECKKGHQHGCQGGCGSYVS